MKYVTSKLYSTKDYRLFEPSPHNRDIKKTKMLAESMATYGFDEGFPVRCRPAANGRLSVTHGHHRLHVAESLQLPVWFVVAKKDIPMFESETSNHQWNVTDFVVARARAQEKPALDVLEYQARTGISLTQCISLLGGESAGSSNKTNQIKSGTYKVKKNGHAEDVAHIVLTLKEIGVAFATNNYFVNAISKVLQVPVFDVGTFLHKCKTHKEIMEQRRNVDDFLDLIELVYNRQTPKANQVNIAFLAKTASCQKKDTFGRFTMDAWK